MEADLVWDEPFCRVRRDGYEICFVPDAGVPLDEIDDVDMWVTFDTGERWSGTIHTLEVVRQTMDDRRQTGESLGGRYFFVWDGLIVRDRGIPGMVEVVDELVRSGDYRCVFRDVGPEDPDD
ncbi:hypothetical protein J7F01_25925 [Streptomyces sp. ISL-22]|uniref:hypothetical protein n=1 Tax=unclassified Streptomyces TaxID=2593676 RepID=UPI001BEB8DC6|nr:MULTISPECIES: hypothetical protein [unclassified Streptomyces]MBT2417127.1 hypothetical protein [Streptomyces sp. ISL-24]MBT2435548.1 hypothetical protein [Streptomyces sp. ISL-22]